MSREHVHVSVTALVQCGHLVSPARRVVTAMQLPDASPELPEPQVGAWKLTQRHSPNITKDFTGGDLFQSTLRVQAKCGLYAEVRAADRSEVSSAFHAQQSSFGTLRLEPSVESEPEPAQDAQQASESESESAPAPPSGAEENGEDMPEADQAMLLRAFSLQNQLPESATETLKALPGEVLMNVLMRGPLDGGDPMAALRKRIEEVK
eukprot:g31665.t1